MTPDLVSSPSWLAAGCTMVHFLWVGAAIGLVAWAVRLVLNDRQVLVRYRLTLITLALLAVTPVVLFLSINQQVRMPVNETRAGLPQYATHVAGAIDLDSPEMGLPDGALDLSGLPAMADEAAPSLRGTISVAMAAAIDRASAGAPWLWGVGSAMLLGFTALSAWSTRRLRRRARWEAGRIQSRCDVIAASMGISRVGVAICEGLRSPVLAGVRQPVILLPTPCCRQWNADQIDMVLLHELWHVKRRDNLVNLLQCVAEAVFFFQPAVWYLSRRARLDREDACDRIVLARTGRRRAYAELLVTLADASVGCRCVTGMGEHNLVSRVRRILDLDHPRRRSRTTLMLAGGSLTLASLGLVAYTYGGVLPVPHADQPQNSDDTDNPIVVMMRELERQANQQDKLSPNPAAPLLTGTPDQQLTTLRVVDDQGYPVAGAVSGANARWRDTGPSWDDSALSLSDERGVVTVALPKKPTSLFVYHPDRQLAGTVNLAKPVSEVAAPVQLLPTCRVRYAVDVTAVEVAATWAKGLIYLPGTNCEGMPLLRQTVENAFQFECELPPGNYILINIAGDNVRTRTRPSVTCFTVPTNTTELDVGTIALTPNKSGKLTNTDSPEPASPAAGFGGASAADFTDDEPVAGLFDQERERTEAGSTADPARTWFAETGFWRWLALAIQPVANLCDALVDQTSHPWAPPREYVHNGAVYVYEHRSIRSPET